MERKNIITLILEKIDEIGTMHPYKIPGVPETYDKYNEAWTDCCNLIASHVETMEPNWIEISNLPIDGEVSEMPAEGETVWITVEYNKEIRRTVEAIYHNKRFYHGDNASVFYKNEMVKAWMPRIETPLPYPD